MKKSLIYLSLMFSIFLIFKNDVHAYTYLEKDIPNNSYVIGTHLYTREKNDNYDGTLKTKYIMLGSDTINSDNIDDMIIYYKNPRGEWINELTEEEVVVGSTFNITHKNTIVSLSKPVIEVISHRYQWAVPNESGYYKYAIQISNLLDYSVLDTIVNYNFEIYQKDIDGNYEYLNTSIIDDTSEEHLFVEVNPDEKAIFVVRVYRLDEDGQKIYSDYSEELMINAEIKAKPVINFNELGYNANTNSYAYSIGITNREDFVESFWCGSDENGNLIYCSEETVTNTELYRKIDGEYEYVKETTFDYAVLHEVAIDEKEELALRVYVLGANGKKVYSDYSDTIVIDNTNIQLKKPVIGVRNLSFGEEFLTGNIYLKNNDYYECTDNFQCHSISGFELYSSTTDSNMSNTLEEDGVNYYLLSTIYNDYQYNGMIPIAVGTEGYTQIARVFIEKKDGTRIYSDFSETIKVISDLSGNLMVTTEEKPEKPNVDYVVEKVTNSSESIPSGMNCDNNACVNVYINLDENQYLNDDNYYTINGIEFYRLGSDEYANSVVINDKNYINTDNLSYQNGLDFSMPQDFPDYLPVEYAVRVYVLDKNGEKIYSDPEFVTINSYEEYKETLKQELLKELENKDFDEIVDNFIIDIYENLYENYSGYQKVYKDLPNINYYIKNNLIDIIPTIKSITFYKNGTEEAEEILNNTGLAYTSRDEEGNPYIVFVYNEYNDNEDKIHLQDIEALFHEIIHCKQVDLMDKIPNYRSNALWFLLVEGGATWNARFVNENRIYNGGNGMPSCDSDFSICFEYNKENGVGGTYIEYMHGYELLNYLLGYETIDKMEKGNVSFEDLESLLLSQTGEDIFELLSIWSDQNKTYYDSDSFAAINTIEKVFVDVIKKDLNDLDSNNKELVKKYINIYRNYKYKVMPKVGEGNAIYNYEDDIAEDYFDINSLDEILINKILASDIMVQFSNNDNLNRMAIKSILKANRYEYYQNDDIYQSLNLPYDISTISYNYFEDNGNGHLILKYENPNPDSFGREVIFMEYIFDENEILSIKEASEILKNEFTIYNNIYKK